MKPSNIVKKYLDKYPDMASATMAKLIFKENKLYFNTLEAVRSAVRHLRGTIGMRQLKEIKCTKYLSKEKLNIKYNLPVSIETEYKPVHIQGNKVLIFSDAHVPFHSIKAHEAMFDFTEKLDIDTIVLLGDIMDCFSVSSFRKDPTIVKFIDEIGIVKDYLRELRRIYPKAKIIYKFGNHERRFEDYLQVKAAEIFGLPEFRLEILLDLYNIGIQYIQEDARVELRGLNLIHGHEYKNGITSPANPARTYFLRTKSTALGGHFHQTSEHTETTISGKTITCWSLGCMSELHPRYMPLNKWNHGFAIFSELTEEMWNVRNYKILPSGHVV